ncbi:polysaccharide deacetylase [Burkholderia contaminans]|uniref:polysaccharide deacetylase family protein n=1 Tax=Burkholderia contaminans TaxID=488447 RepID=UPI002417EA4C|nr:polysaccharide deacetylase [Burkholderia contaminans]WFN15407.1 polysaccharide deacetylase [Burkholderia contaminans]
MHLKPFSWPGHCRAVVSITFDVDAESGWITDPENRRRLSLMSMGAFGRRAGVPRILDLLRRHDLQAQFFVPGYTAEIDRKLVEAIHEAGHPIGCHGYFHERTDGLTYEVEDASLAESKAILADITGVTPIGYRAPQWEVTPQTLELLDKHGFAYDSSLMGQDIPYAVHAGSKQLLELPVTWMLDDWEQFAYSAVPQVGAVIEEPEKVFRLWKDEFDALYREGRYFMLTMHPEIIGRASRIAMLDKLITYIKKHDDVWFCTPHDLYVAWSENRFKTDVFPY